jgi:hypothetical protein
LGEDVFFCTQDILRCEELLEHLNVQKSRLQQWVHNTLGHVKESLANATQDSGQAIILSRWQARLATMLKECDDIMW